MIEYRISDFQPALPTAGSFQQRKAFEIGDVEHWNSDGIALARTLNENSVAAWIYDPPFPKVAYNRSLGTTTRLSMSRGSSNYWFDDSAFTYENHRDLVDHAFRTLLPGGHFLMKCDMELVCETIKHLSSSELIGKFIPQKLLIWDKDALGTGYVFRSRHEYWFWAVKGKKRRRVPSENRSLSDVFRYKRLKGKSFTPAQTPLTMVYDLVRQVTSPGDLVFDPFAGGGATVPLSCLVLDRKCISAEFDPHLWINGCDRLLLAEEKKTDIISSVEAISKKHQTDKHDHGERVRWLEE